MNKTFLLAYQESYISFAIAMEGLAKSFEHYTTIGLKELYGFPETEAFDALVIKLTRNSDVFFSANC